MTAPTLIREPKSGSVVRITYERPLADGSPDVSIAHRRRSDTGQQRWYVDEVDAAFAWRILIGGAARIEIATQWRTLYATAELPTPEKGNDHD